MTPDEQEAALLRAAARGEAGEDMPAMLARMLTTHAAILRGELEGIARAAAARPQWARLQQIADHFGVTRATVNNWLPPLIAAGRVRILTPPGGGYTLYNIADIENAFTPKK